MIANVHEAKSQLSKLLDAAQRGEEVFITRRGMRFMIVPAPVVDRSRLFGAWKGTAPSDEEWAAGDAEVLADFEAGLLRDDEL